MCNWRNLYIFTFAVNVPDFKAQKHWKTAIKMFDSVVGTGDVYLHDFCGLIYYAI